MLGDIHDDFFGARLVADARLHLSTIMNGEYSEAFFVTMCKIVSNKVYRGYKTFKGEDIELSGIKDFMYSSLYGLGLKVQTINQFLANCSKAARNDKTQTQYSMKFISWLQEQDEKFQFPQELFELKRLRSYVSMKYKSNKQERWMRLSLLERIYAQKPHLLEQIGGDRKYKDVVTCCEDNDLFERKRKLKGIYMFRNPTAAQVKEVAEALNERLDKYEKRVLIARLIELYKIDEGQGDGSTGRSD